MTQTFNKGEKMGGYKANEASLKQALNKAMLKRWESGKTYVEFAKQQLSNLIDRPKPGLPALPADVVEEHRPGLEKAVRDAEKEAAKREKSWNDMMFALSGSLAEVRNFIEREALHEDLREGLSFLVIQSKARAALGREPDMESKLNELGYLDRLQSDVERWGIRCDEWEMACFLLDIQATRKWLTGEYQPEIASAKQAEEPAADRQRGRKVKLPLEVFEREIFPILNKEFPLGGDSAGIIDRCVEIGKQYGVSGSTIKGKFYNQRRKLLIEESLKPGCSKAGNRRLKRSRRRHALMLP